MFSTVTYADEAGSGYRFTYNPAGQLEAVSDLGNPARVLESHAYDGTGRAISSEVGPLGAGVERYSLVYGPSTEAPKTTVTDGRGNVTTYEWHHVAGVKHVRKIIGPCASCGGTGGDSQEVVQDSRGRVVSYKDGGGFTTKYEYNATTGKLTKKIDALGKETNFEYDAQGRLTRRWEPEGAQTVWAHVAAGPSVITERVSLPPSEVNRTTSITYNADGKPEFVTNGENEPPTQLSYSTKGDLQWVEDGLDNRTSFEYDLMGRRELTILPPTTPATQLPRTTYNVRGQVKRITNPDGSYTEFTYDKGARREKVREPVALPAERFTLYAYDSYGRLETITDAKSGITRYAYDAMSNLTSLTNARLNATRFEDYDGHNRVRRIVHPGERAETFTYDAAGRLASHTDRKSVTTSYSYDGLGRLLQKSYSGPGVTAQPLTYTYDRRGLTSAANTIETVSRTYDLVGQLLSESSSKNASTVEYVYDLAGRRKTLKLDGTVEANYVYDGAGRLDLVTRGTKTFDVGYDAASRRTSLLHPNTVLTTYSYDPLSRLSKVETKKGSTLISKAEYPTFDDADNRLEKNTQDVSEDYSYDELYRLRTVLRGSTTTEDYSYDEVGNRRPTGSTGWVLNERNELTATPSLTLTYDLNGNRITRTGAANAWVYTWNVRNELTKVEKDTVAVATYQYDALGRRVQKVAGGLTYKYTYDGEDILRQRENDGTSQITRRFIHGPGIDEPWARFTANAFTYYHADGLGSVLKITDNAGTVDASYRYNAFGEIEVGQSREGYAFTGREWDPEAKLYYYRARYYDPQLGRFLSEDPIRFAGGINFYSYVRNNPVNWTDPTGLQTLQECVGLARHVARSFRRGTGDKYMHCVVSCVLEIVCGSAKAMAIGIGKEIDDIFGPGDADIADLAADLQGLRCGGRVRRGDVPTCEVDCRRIYP